MATIAEQQRWRTEYQTARERWDATRAGPPGPVDSRSATGSPDGPHRAA